MQGKSLKNPPLAEAIFEIKWQSQQLPVPETGLVGYDPHYSLLIGRLYDKLKDKYPFHEPLPTASIPGDILPPGVVQHRFRKGRNEWPVIQLGPGVFTVNDTHQYTWQDFERRITDGINILFEVYPDSKSLLIYNMVLRYINAIEFNFDEDISQFLSEQLKVDISLHRPLFENDCVEKNPLDFSYKFTFSCTRPKAVINLVFARGKKQDVDALIWETSIISRSNEIPALPTDLKNWLNNAHNILEDWFFKLVEGDLLERFK